MNRQNDASSELMDNTMTQSSFLISATILICFPGTTDIASAQGPHRGRGPDAEFQADRAAFHFLLKNHKQIQRRITLRKDGVETVTESKNPAIAAKLKVHVRGMYRRVEKNRPIRRRDPLFAKLFRNSGKISMKVTNTKSGVRVVETSKDPYVVRLIQEHAKVVSAFVKNGFAEAHMTHAVPKLPKRADQSKVDISFWKPLPKKAPAPKDNPTTAARVELGKKLYFDPRISSTGTVSCNTCHNLMEGGDDGRPTSMGILGKLGGRNAPTVWNSAFNSVQFWDGRAKTLEEQAKGPIINKVEMGMPSHGVAVKRLAGIIGYRKEFAKVFGNGAKALTIGNAVKAIAAFERTLVTPDSPYDRYVKGDTKALSAQQIRGMQTFRNVGCTSCHSGPAFNGKQFELPVGKAHFEKFPVFSDNAYSKKFDLLKDYGRFELTKQPGDKHRYKVPVLRNITLTAPYMHNGKVPSLTEAVRVMAVSQLATELTNEQTRDIVSFLSALTGKFPKIAMPRLPSRSGQSILHD